MLEINAKIRPQMLYRLTARKRNGNGEVVSERSTPEIPNVFTNYGVEAIFGATTGDNTSEIACVVGSGSAAPSVTDTSLATFVAGAYSTGSYTRTWVDNGDGTGYKQSQKSTVFAAGVATGILSEVGSCFRGFTPTSSTPICSRALILDTNGDPTTFEVLPDEELEVTQFFRQHVSTDTTETQVFDGDDEYDVLCAPVGMATDMWGFPAASLIGASSTIYYCTGGTPVVSSVGGASQAYPGMTGGTGADSINTSQGASAAIDAYVPNSKTNTAWIRVGAGARMLIYGATICIPSLGAYQVGINPAIDKGDLYRATIKIRFTIDNTI